MNYNFRPIWVWELIFLFGVVGTLSFIGALAYGLIFGTFFLVACFMSDYPKYLLKNPSNAALQEESNTITSDEKIKPVKVSKSTNTKPKKK